MARILIATDAWHPQVNGVVRTLTSLARAAQSLGTEITFLTPEGFPSFQVPTYPGLRLAITNRREIARRIEQAAPDAIHIATEGTIGWAVRRYCLRHGLAFTTSYTTRFPEYVSVRTGIPDAVGYWVMRRPGCQWLTGIAPTLELHYTTTLDNADIRVLPIANKSGGLSVVGPNGAPVAEPNSTVGNLRNRVDILDLTVGTTFEFNSRATLAAGFAFPLKGSSDRTFDWEFQLQLNYYFGCGPQ